MKVRFKLDLCSGHAHCAEKCPEVFDTDDTMGQCLIRNEEVPEELEAKVRSAVKSCPEGALSISR